MAHESHESVGGLVRGALDDMRDLFREEVALAKAEARQELSKVAAAGAWFGIAGAALWFAGMLLLVAAALGVDAIFGWPAWVGFAIVAFVMAVTGGAMAMAGRRAVRNVRPLRRTVSTIKENFR